MNPNTAIQGPASTGPQLSIVEIITVDPKYRQLLVAKKDWIESIGGHFMKNPAEPDQASQEDSKKFGDLLLQEDSDMFAQGHTHEQIEEPIELYFSKSSDSSFNKEEFKKFMRTLKDDLPSDAFLSVDLTFSDYVEPSIHLMRSFEKDRIRLGKPELSIQDAAIREIFANQPQLSDPQYMMGHFESSLDNTLPNGLTTSYSLEEQHDGRLVILGSCRWEQKEKNISIEDLQVAQMARMIVLMRDHAAKSINPKQNGLIK